MVTGGGCGKSLSPLFLFSEKALPLLISFSGKITFCFHRKSSCPFFFYGRQSRVFLFFYRKSRFFVCFFSGDVPSSSLFLRKSPCPFFFLGEIVSFPSYFFFRKSPSPLVLLRARRATPLSIILDGP